MYDHPNNYVEAKKMIEEFIDNDYEQHKLKIAKYRAMLIAGLGVGASVAIGVVNNDPMLGTMALPPVMMVASPFIMPYFIRKRTRDRIKSGEYFKEKSEDRIMNVANIYVDAYNELEAKGKIK